MCFAPVGRSPAVGVEPDRKIVYVQAIFSTNGDAQYVRVDEMELEC